MKSFARSRFLCLAMVVPCSHAAAPDPSLLGCWRAVKIVLVAQDGVTTQDTSGRCSLRFKEDLFESACATSGARAVTTTYQYRLVRPGFYSATMTGSTYKTDLLGATREYEYRVEADRLFTVTGAQVKPPAAPARASRVELEAAKMPCP